MNTTPSSLSPIRQALITKGLIYAPERGYVDLATGQASGHCVEASFPTKVGHQDHPFELWQHANQGAGPEWRRFPRAAPLAFRRCPGRRRWGRPAGSSRLPPSLQVSVPGMADYIDRSWIGD